VISQASFAGAILILCLQTAPSAAQAPLSPDLQKQQAQEQAGIENAWNLRPMLESLAERNQQLAPILSSLKPQQWCDQKGAPTTYILQSQLAQQQVKDVATSISALMQQTDNLSLGLDLYFRFEALEMTSRSLLEGANKYADRVTAQKLGAQLAQNFADRERFRDYLKDLAASTQQNFKIADAEAQRCRGMISKEPPKKIRK
jgi:hypothetical protein